VPPPPAPEPTTITPTTISGPVGTPVTGQFMAAPAEDGTTFTAADPDGTGVSVALDGSFSASAGAAVTGTLQVTVVRANGINEGPFPVSVSFA
jgi:hypothetical protein